MGATQSVDTVADALPDVPQDAPAQDPSGQPTTLLYKYNMNTSAQQWVLASRNAQWRFYDNNEGATSKTAWFLEIESGDVDLWVCEEAELQTDLSELTATFFDAENAAVCKLKFADGESCRSFCDKYFNKLYENLSSNKELNVGTQGDWWFKPAESEPMEWDPTPDAPPAEAQPATPKVWTQREAMSTPQQAVHGMCMGAGDNSFLVQSGRVSVLRNEFGGVSETQRGFSLTPLPRTPAGFGETVTSFTPGKSILAAQERQMNMLSPEQRESVYQADLGQGRIVRQWHTNKNGVEVPMADIANDTKDAQLDHRSTFLGLDNNRLCRWDQRTAEGVVQDLSSLKYNAGRDYSRGTNFTCMATSGDGYIVVGSKDGRIRLFGSKQSMESYEFKQASTAVPGLGLPITAIDVSYDSRYVVATTDKYLVVLQTFYKDAKGRDASGFTSRMGGNIPPPKLLRLKAEDRVKVGAKAALSKANFTWITSNDMTERWIAAGCGNYTVMWNFRRIKSAKPNVISSGAFTVTDHYTLIAKNERVIDNAFLHEKFAKTPQSRNALVVATQHKLWNYKDGDENSDFED